MLNADDYERVSYERVSNEKMYYYNRSRTASE